MESGAEFGLRFTSGGEFYTLFLGDFILEGTYASSRGILELHYYDCQTHSSCDVRLGYTVTESSLIITDSTGDIRLKRIR